MDVELPIKPATSKPAGSANEAFRVFGTLVLVAFRSLGILEVTVTRMVS